jgi:hypothetical protein
MSGVDHHCDRGGDGGVPHRQPFGVGAGGGQAPVGGGVPQHPRGEIDAQRAPAKIAHGRGVHAGAAADLQAGAAVALAKQPAQRAVDADGIGAVVPPEELLLVPVGDLVVRRARHHSQAPSPRDAFVLPFIRFPARRRQRFRP